MSASRSGFGSTWTAPVVLVLVTSCALGGSGAPSRSSCGLGGAQPPDTTDNPIGAEGDALVIVGRIVTMTQPAEAEALLIEAGVVRCVGTWPRS